MPIPVISELVHKRPRRRTALAALALPALAGLLATAAPASAAAAPAQATTGAKAAAVSAEAGLSPQVSAMVKGTGLAAREQALATYWTPARMKAALPDSQLPTMLHAAASKPAATTTPAAPQGSASRVAPAAGKATRAGISPQGYAYYPGYPVGSPPAITTGKVYFTLSGVNYQCSASTVNSEGKSTVWTAGHCVTGGQVWATNWTFVPNCYNNGAGGCAAPFGYWYGEQLFTPTAYFNTNDLADDVAAVLMYPNYGYEIINYLGGQGIEWNYAIGQYMCAFGYPVPGFTGLDLVEACDYTYASPFDSNVYMFNNMTGGSSGGPWLASFNGSYGYIDGHNDYRYNAYPNDMWSPYYGNQVANLFNTVRYLVG